MLTHDPFSVLSLSADPRVEAEHILSRYVIQSCLQRGTETIFLFFLNIGDRGMSSYDRDFGLLEVHTYIEQLFIDRLSLQQGGGYFRLMMTATPSFCLLSHFLSHLAVSTFPEFTLYILITIHLASVSPSTARLYGICLSLRLPVLDFQCNKKKLEHSSILFECFFVCLFFCGGGGGGGGRWGCAS